MVQMALTDQTEHTHLTKVLFAVQRTLTDQKEHTPLTKVGVLCREHLLIKQSIHYWRALACGIENTY